LVILFTLYSAALPETIFAFGKRLNAVGAVKTGQEDFDKKFRQGRDLIDDEK